MTYGTFRSRLRPWMLRIGRGAGGQCKLSKIRDGGAFDVVVTWKDNVDGERIEREYCRPVAASDLRDKPCVFARAVLNHVLRLRGAVD